MTPGPLVSCTIPVFNGERYLAPAIESILQQSENRVEVLVVDDGSTDGTAGVAASFGAAVRYLHQSNAGPAAAINHGWRESRGAFLTVLDADDLWAPGRLTRQLAHFEAHPALDISLGLVLNFWEPELAAEAEKFRGHRLSEPIAAYSVAAMLARRETVAAVGELTAARRHGFSVDWFMRARERGLAIATVPEVLLHRRLHPNNRSRLFNRRSRDEFLDMLKQSLDRQRAGGDP